MMRAMFFLGLVVVVQASSLSFDADDAKNRPVTKVVTLMEDMQKELEAEEKADQETYDKFKCWCDTNEAEKTKAIADAEAKIKDLNIAIEELTATSARLGTEITTLESEYGKNQGTLAQANEMRMKGQTEFNAE